MFIPEKSTRYQIGENTNSKNNKFIYNDLKVHSHPPVATIGHFFIYFNYCQVTSFF